MVNEETKKKLRRPLGAVFILLSAVEAKYFVFDVLDRARQSHEATFTYSENEIFLPAVTLLLGVLMLFFSDAQLKSFRSEDRKITKAGWALVVVTIVAMFGMSEWFKSEVKKLGYVSSDSMELRTVDEKPSANGDAEK